jgi:hypothetical protein
MISFGRLERLHVVDDYESFRGTTFLGRGHYPLELSATGDG